MHIGILTFFETDNYGTVLQAYALQKYFENMGHVAELIHIPRDQYGVNRIGSPVQYSFIDKIKIKVSKLCHRKDNSLKHKAFSEYRKKLHICEKFYSMSNLSQYDWNDYDLYVSGGDQIWNMQHKTFSCNYMFDFLPDNKKRISYASSFGQKHILDRETQDKFSSLLKKYKHISVRETSGVELVAGLGLQCEQVLDPVFLIRDEWLKIKDHQKKKEKYCVVYAISDYPRQEDILIKEYAKKNKLKVVILPENNRNHLTNYRKAFGLSPEGFLELIANCEAVFTNSFHGLAFSLLFNKQFFILSCIKKEGQDKKVRLTDLLTEVGIFNDRNLNTDSRLDYSLINNNLSSLISKSRDYLKGALKEDGCANQ